MEQKKSERSVLSESDGTKLLGPARVIRRQVENGSVRTRDGNSRCGEIGDTAPRDGVLLIAWVTRGRAGGAGRIERERR